jgi:hypothetical protein
MIAGELKSKIDSVWNDFWSGGISNPLEVMEQLTYMLFIKGLDGRQTLAENKANQTGQPIDDVVFPKGSSSQLMSPASSKQSIISPRLWRKRRVDADPLA